VSQAALQAEAAAAARRDQCRSAFGEAVPDHAVLSARATALRTQIEALDAAHRESRSVLENTRLDCVRATAELDALQHTVTRRTEDRERGQRDGAGAR